jgi:hypothetical protein
VTAPQVNPYQPPVLLGLDAVRAGQILLVSFNGDTRYYEVLSCALEEETQGGTRRGPAPGSITPARVTLRLGRCLWLNPETRDPDAPAPPVMGVAFLDLNQGGRGAEALTIGRLVYLLDTVEVIDRVSARQPTGARYDGPKNIIVTLERAWWRDLPVDAGRLSGSASTR